MSNCRSAVNLTEWFLDRNLVGEQANRVAYFSGERAVTYRTLNEWVNRFANALRGLGIEQGDRVMLRVANSVEYVVCALAVGRLAAVVVPDHDPPSRAGHHPRREHRRGEDNHLRSRSAGRGGGRPTQLHHRRAHHLHRRGSRGSAPPRSAELRRLLASGSDRIESVRVHADSLAATFFTSGTTGLPKGCMHLISTIIGSVHSFPLTFGGLRSTDVFLGSPAPGLRDRLWVQHAASSAGGCPQRDPRGQDVGGGLARGDPRAQGDDVQRSPDGVQPDPQHAQRARLRSEYLARGHVR